MTVTLKGVAYNICTFQIEQAREWILDCSWRETEDGLELLSDLEVVQGIEKHCAGGWLGFVKCAIAEMDSLTRTRS